jgi:hypothetical protein
VLRTDIVTANITRIKTAFLDMSSANLKTFTYSQLTINISLY